MSNEQFNPELLVIARGACGLTQTQLAIDIDVRQGRISRWEDGISVPSEDEVLRIADRLSFPSKFFYQSDTAIGAEVSFMYHRKRRRTKISVLNQLHCRVNILRIGIARLLRSIEEFPVRIDSIDVDEYGSAEEVARTARAAWQLPAASPIRNLVGLMEKLGTIVVRIPFNTDQVDAVHVWPWDMPPLVFLNDSCPADRERFSLAHELGHMVMHRIPTPHMEEEADSFARELLLPEAGLRVDIPKSLTLKDALRLKPKWGASGQAIIYQSHQIGAITKRKYESLYKYLSKLGYRKREPNPIEREEPTTLRRLIDLHRQDLGYSVDELAESVFLTTDRFKRYYSPNEATKPHKLRVVGDSIGLKRVT